MTTVKVVISTCITPLYHVSSFPSETANIHLCYYKCSHYLTQILGFIEITWVFALLIFCLCYGFGRILYNNDVTCKWQETTQPTRLPALGLQCYLHNNTALLIYFDYWISFNKFCLLKLLVANKPSTAEQILMCIFRNSFS